MKSLFSVLTWTLLFLLLGFYINLEVTNFTSRYEHRIDIIETHIISSNWDKAEEELDELIDSWHKEKNIWYKLLNHDYFDNVSLNLNILSRSILIKDKSLSLEQIQIIKMSLDNIVESEKCDLNHIF